MRIGIVEGGSLPSSRYSGFWYCGFLTIANLIFSKGLPLIFVKSESRCLVSLKGSSYIM